MTDKAAYVTASSRNSQSAIKSYSDSIAGSSVASCCGRGNVASTDEIDYRYEYNREAYDAFRPGEAVPTTRPEIIGQCVNSYKTVGLVRNMIDLMSDFGCQGINIVHPNKKIEKFYQNWAVRVRMKDRSERFLNNLYKTGTTIIRRQRAKLSLSDSRKIQRSIASNPLVKVTNLETGRREIPIRYTFLNPCTVKLSGDAVAVFSNKKRYVIEVPVTLRNVLTNPNINQQSLVNEVPKEIIDSLNKGKPIALDADNTLVYHYKKDDWQLWADPMIYSILTDINLLKKMKLADSSALDGAIDNVRIYKLGDFEHKILPTDVAFAKLARLLKANVGAGTREIIWGPDIKIIESKTDAYQFLGDDKYVPILAAIYAGLGIPPTLTGTDKAGSGTTNNLISLKTLVKRLEYGRDKLREFWEQEMEIVRVAMGFRVPAELEFANNNLGDEEAEKKLFIELAERDIVSDEFIQRKFGAIPNVEVARQKRETLGRKSKKRRPKASPYHNANHGQQVERILLENGQISPSQICALDLCKGKPGDKPIDINNVTDVKNNPEKSETPVKPTGRPPNSKDLEPRKRKRFVPVVKASVMKIWASKAYDDLSDLLSSKYLIVKGKKNLRSLSSLEFEELESFKLGVLFNIEPMSDLNDDEILSIAVSEPIKDHYKYCKSLFSDYEKQLKRPLSIAEKRDVQLSYYIDSLV